MPEKFDQSPTKEIGLYTLVFDFRGGTYVSQISAYDPSEAARKWAAQLQIETISGMTKNMKIVLSQEVTHADITALDLTTNVWCITALLEDRLALINIIATCSS